METDDENSHRPAHPLIGDIAEDDIHQLLAPPAPPDIHHIDIPPPSPKTYCESCGHVDSHADGCPQATAAAVLAELDEEEAVIAAEEMNRPEPILPLVRRIGASLLRRVAKIVEPKNSR